jgi:hypothetical protein
MITSSHIPSTADDFVLSSWWYCTAHDTIIMASWFYRTVPICKEGGERETEPTASSSFLTLYYDPSSALAYAFANAAIRTKSTPPKARKIIPPVTTSNAAGTKSLKLKLNAPPSKLREVVRASEADSLRDTLGGGQVIDGPRRRRNQPPPRVSGRAAPDRPKYQEYGESDIEDEDADGEDEIIDNHMNGEPEEDSDEEEDEDDDDIDMPDAPAVPKPPVKVTLKPPTKGAKAANPVVKVTPANVGPVKSVEEQEMKDDPGDEEVDDSSDLSGDDDEDDDEEEEEEEEPTALAEEDAAGEDEEAGDAPGEEEELDEEDGDDDDDSDESDDTPGSGAATPDPHKQTKRQRRQSADGLMALDMAPQQRKVGRVD